MKRISESRAPVHHHKGVIAIPTFAPTFYQGKRFETQTRLAQRAIQNCTFTKLHQLLRWNVLIDLSIDKVLSNTGSKTPGIDGKTRKHYTSDEQKRGLRQQVKEIFGHLMSSPVRRIFIPKPHKPQEQRPLGIPTIANRVAQDVVRNILEPIYECKQHRHSYGFRPFRCTHHAIERIRRLAEQQQYHWVVEIDIKGFFDNVDHDILMKLLVKDIRDKKLLKLIRNMLKAGFIHDGEFQVTDLGTPQGGLCSPLLANVYLTELDQFIANLYENRTDWARKKSSLPCFIIRYADDAVIMCKTQADAEELKEKVRLFLQDNLKLELSAGKTLVTHVDNGFDFLGFNIKRWKRQGRQMVLVKPSRKAIQKFKRTMSRDSKMLLYLPGEIAIKKLNAKIRGFAEYFRRGNAKKIFRDIDHYLWWLALHRLTQRTGQSRVYVAQTFLFRYNMDRNHPQYLKYAARNFGFKDEVNGGAHILDRLQYYKIEYINQCSQKHPYIKEDREQLDRDRKLNNLLNIHKKRFLQRLFGRDNWFSFRTDVIKRQQGRCATCKRNLTQSHTHVYFRDTNSHLEHPEEEWNEYLIALCISCYKRKQRKRQG
ncbi:Group II intron-encoded protein LtrA [Paenibacillus konkukensis]|uniref:Group II intron-encoded protein LtrA n=1 Tax=Paenibacillus konkukensis TaxID=2020716 RepID=A0ABY4RVD8_9BACL|nr:group II intron reverse transcriptase/maturase [Paenibacillus konkukensis]UQZ85402.1 Group II intron-encoded protein LtrA [Paenibacillus konkukensis]